MKEKYFLPYLIDLNNFANFNVQKIKEDMLFQLKLIEKQQLICTFKQFFIENPDISAIIVKIKTDDDFPIDVNFVKDQIDQISQNLGIDDEQAENYNNIFSGIELYLSLIKKEGSKLGSDLIKMEKLLSLKINNNKFSKKLFKLHNKMLFPSQLDRLLGSVLFNKNEKDILERAKVNQLIEKEVNGLLVKEDIPEPKKPKCNKKI